MKFFSWNCRGLGSPRSVRSLRDVVRAFNPQIVCLLETKKRSSEWDRIKISLGIRNCFAVSSCRLVVVREVHTSDHQLLLIDTDKRCHVRRQKLFRFEAMWLEHPEFSPMMDEFWNSTGNTRLRWSSQLRRCKTMLQVWNQSAFGNVQKRIKGLKEELQEVKTAVRTAEIMEKEKQIVEELDIWLAREETLWLQRSRVLWLHQGDKNTSFFHARASQRQKKNWIAQMQNSYGIMFDDQAEIMNIVTTYFDNMFQSSLVGDCTFLEEQLQIISPMISNGVNSQLLQDITEEEVKRDIAHFAFARLSPFSSLDFGSEYGPVKCQVPNPLTNSNFTDRWSPPQMGEIKINSDGSWEGNSREAGVGVVARDHYGTVLWAWADNLRLDVYKALVAGTEVAAWTDSWLEQAMNYLQSNPSWNIHLVGRDVNGVADLMAFKARAFKWQWKDLDAIPRGLSVVLC
ncbi:hypothetical protein QQ045_000707 [Rhodiola kirilowii]